MKNAIIVVGLSLCVSLKVFAQSFDEVKKLAQSGDATAQCNLGFSYATGNGVQANMEEAAKWFMRSAEQGHSGGMSNLGMCYEYGRGVNKNISEAIKWYNKAVDLGDTTAALNLGVLFYNGQEAPQNFLDAYRFIKIAAELGDSDAKGHLISIERVISASEKEQIDELLKPKIAKIMKLRGITQKINVEKPLSEEDQRRSVFLNGLLLGDHEVAYFADGFGPALQRRPKKNTVYNLKGMKTGQKIPGGYLMAMSPETVNSRGIFVMLATGEELRENLEFTTNEFWGIYDGEAFLEEKGKGEKDYFKFVLLNHRPTINPRNVDCCDKDAVDILIKKSVDVIK
jgi:hypothetical protein